MRFHQLQNKNLDYQFHLFNSDNMQTLLSLRRFIKMTSKIKGDIAEFGVGRGRSLIILSFLMSQSRTKKKLYAFDSFKGFGKIHKKDKSIRNPKKGEWGKSPDKKYNYNKKFINKIFKSHLHSHTRYPVKLIDGFIEKSLPAFKKINKLSFVHCDVDLYLPHITILNNIWDKLSKNGIILFDDIEPGIKSKKFPGAVKAFNEFFGDKKYKLHSDKARNNVYVIKK